MTPIYALLRRLHLAGLAFMAATAAPIAAQAAEGNRYFAIDSSGLALDDSSVTDSVTVWEDVTGDDEPAATGTGTSSRYADSALHPTTRTNASHGGDGYAADSGFAPSRPPIATYGPFNLVSADTVEMIGTVDSDTPRRFAAMMAAHPTIRRLVMVECPGSVDEAANHILARAVRRAGLSTHVPDGGSVRSGAVDLFLAGVERTAARTAQFGVHSWQDEDGMQADDFAANDPVHAEYLSYYREMGMTERAARAFYALTNSVDFDNVRMLTATDMAVLGLARVSG